MNEQNYQSPAARLRNKLPLTLHPLGDIALNFWWSWSPEQLSLFRDIDDEKWERCCHNPVKLLNAVSHERLTELAIALSFALVVDSIY